MVIALIVALLLGAGVLFYYVSKRRQAAGQTTVGPVSQTGTSVQDKQKRFRALVTSNV